MSAELLVIDRPENSRMQKLATEIFDLIDAASTRIGNAKTQEDFRSHGEELAMLTHLLDMAKLECASHL